MALASSPSRRFYKAALKQASEWGTAVEVGAGDELIVTSDGDPGLRQTYASCDAIGQVMPFDGDLSAYEPIEFAPEFGSKCGLQYAPGPIGSAIAALFGDLTAPAASGTGYSHLFEWADEMPPEAFFTFVTTRPGAIWEIPSCICNKLELKIGDGKVQGSIGLVGNSLNNDPELNDEDSIAALTPEITGAFVKFQHGVVRFNAEDGDALDADDAVEVSDFTITYERMTDAQMSLGGSYISQPKESNFKITVKLTLPYATADNVAYLDLFTLMTAQKMDIVFTGPEYAAAENYTLTLGFPRLKLVAPPDVKLEDIMRNGLEFVAEEAAAAPTGMTAVRPYIVFVNERAGAYLTVA